jgi:hypothetical protein
MSDVATHNNARAHGTVVPATEILSPVAACVVEQEKCGMRRNTVISVSLSLTVTLSSVAAPVGSRFIIV